jgi:serine O-acetyltransferase
MNKMKTNISKGNLSEYINKQLELHFPDGEKHKTLIQKQLDEVFERIEYCFSRINDRYYLQNNTVQFDYLNTDHYATLLYLLSHLLWKNGSNVSVAKKVYYLNKIMHGLEVYYEVTLPAIFRFTHPVGTVLGRAKYSNYLVLSQGVTIGGNTDFKYPNIGEGVYFFAGSAVTGNCNIGDNSLISIGAVVRDTNTPGNSVVFNEGNMVSYKPFAWTVVGRYFKKEHIKR